MRDETVFTVTGRLRKKWTSETGKKSDPEHLIFSEWKLLNFIITVI